MLQGPCAFKSTFKKALVAQIEVIMETRMACRAGLVDPLYTRARPQPQLAYALEDADVLHDAIDLAFSYLSRLSGTRLRLDAVRNNWVEVRLYSIVRAFFQLSEWDERPSVGRPRASGKGPNSHPAGMVSVGTEMVGGATSNGGTTSLVLSDIYS